MSNKPLILVVEDDAAVRNLMSVTLDTQGYRYHLARNGSEALIETSTHQPDVMLLDLGLPDMEGVDIIRKVRGWTSMPIIVISARSEDADKVEALDAGADDYLTKPFSVDELLARLRVALRRLNAEGMNSRESAQHFGLVLSAHAHGIVVPGFAEGVAAFQAAVVDIRAGVDEHGFSFVKNLEAQCVGMAVGANAAKAQRRVVDADEQLPVPAAQDGVAALPVTAELGRLIPRFRFRRRDFRFVKQPAEGFAVQCFQVCILLRQQRAHLTFQT